MDWAILFSSYNIFTVRVRLFNNRQSNVASKEKSAAETSQKKRREGAKER